jgi:UDP-N-acetylmuramate: L-alanyl-gamma-D-glutamyl-meso-diaminopimelate ligase
LLNIVPRNGVAFINGDDKNSCDVAQGAHCPNIKVGMSAENDHRILDVCYRPDGTSFSLQGEEYELPMVGEFNVRNAAMAISAARYAGLSADECRAGLREFDGVARRQELRGEVRGIKVVDDFAHHPTAIRLAVQAMRQRYQDNRLWLLFEPRSNTTKRNVFQAELAAALATADIAVVAALTDIHKVPEAERLDPTRLANDIAAAGGKALYLADVEEIVNHVAREALPGDVVAVLSNGGFGGIHQKLLTALA